MQLDDNSCQPCGCDKGANHMCDFHRRMLTNAQAQTNTPPVFVSGLQQVVPLHVKPDPKKLRLRLPKGDKERKMLPVFTGFLMYFPLACAEVAKVSLVGNEQHNPGQPMHWAREKSTDQLNTGIRHAMDHGMGNIKDDGGRTYHLAKAIWRLAAELELYIENERAEEFAEEAA